jgi:N-acetylneuraminic acid mutarotase
MIIALRTNQERKNHMRKNRFKIKDSFQLANRLTMVVYLGGFFILLLTIAYAGRYVLFMPWTSRIMVSSISVDDHLYTFGGRGDGGEMYQEILEIDLNEKTIKRPAHLPVAKIGISPVSLKGKIYLIGGFSRKTYSNQVLSFSPESGLVEPVTNLPFPVSFGGGFSDGNYLFYMGGWDGQKMRSDILRFDPENDDVRVVGHLPSAREYFSLTVLNDHIYLAGGENPGGDILDEVLEINIHDFKITRTARLPSPRMYMGMSVLNEKVYCFGGWSDKGFFNEILELDPSGSWIKIKAIARLEKKQAHVAAVSNHSRIYIVGGTDERNERQLKVVAFNPDDLSLEALSLRSYSWW